MRSDLEDRPCFEACLPVVWDCRAMVCWGSCMDKIHVLASPFIRAALGAPPWRIVETHGAHLHGWNPHAVSPTTTIFAHATDVTIMSHTVPL